MLLLAFLVLFPRILLGFLIVHSIWKSVEIRDLLIKVFLAGPLGLGASSLVSFLWIWAKLDLHTYAWLETIGTLLFVIFVLWKQRSAVVEFFKHRRPTLSKQNALWFGILSAAFLICAVKFWFNSLQNPHGWWDAWENWNVVARFVYRGGEHWTGTFLRLGDHYDYPLLQAMSNAISWELLSRETTRGPMALAFLFTTCLSGLLFGLINKARDLPQAALGTIVLVTMPFIAYQGMGLYADLPASYFFLASAGLMPIYLNAREKSLPILAGFMAGLAAWTKNEGLAFVVISAILWGASSYFYKDKSALRNFLLGLSFPLVVIILFKVFLAPDNYLFSVRRDPFELIRDIERYKIILKHGALIFWNLGDGPVSTVGILAVYALIVGKTANSIRGIAQVIVIVLLQLCVYFLVYLVTPYDLDWQIRGSLSRLYLHVFPLMLLCLFLWLGSPHELLLKKDVQNANAAHP